MELISVIVPVYKVEPYLRRCIDSILAQTYTNFEIILVDDGSPDTCGAICDEYAVKDKRIKVIHQENRGLSGARNTGLEVAGGEFISFIDSDDAVDPRFLELLLYAIKSENAGIVECARVDIYDNSLPLLNQDEVKIESYDGQTAFALLLPNRKFHQTVWNKLYTRNAIGNLLFAEQKLHEDEFFTWKAFLNCSRIAWISNALYFYYHREGSIMETFSPRRFDFFEARLERHSYIQIHKPELISASKLEIALPCIFFMQTLLKQKNKDMRIQHIPTLKAYYRCICIAASERKNLPANLKLWLYFADVSLVLCGRIRNLLDKIRRGNPQ